MEHRRDRRAPLRLLLSLLAHELQVGIPDDATSRWAEALDLVIEAASARGEYSSMVRSLLRQIAPWRSEWSPPGRALLDSLRADAARGLVLEVPPL